MRKLILLLCIILPSLAYAQGGLLAPVACQQFFSSTGQPLAGGLLYSFRSGTLIPQATFTDSTLSQPNPVPLQLNAGGFAVNPSGGCGLWLNPALTYTFTLRSALGVPQWSVDGVTASDFQILLNQTNTWTQLQTFNAGITGIGTIGTLGLGSAALSANNNWTGNQTNSGTATFTGLVTATTIDGQSINDVLYVGTGAYATPEAAIAACPAAPTGCKVYVTAGQYNSAGFTLGVGACQQNFAQVLEMDPAANITLNGQIILLCGGYIYGDARDGSTITVGPTFPINTYMVQMGDNITNHLVDARIEGVSINCALQGALSPITGCGGVVGYGLNENSYIGRNVIQNYLTGGIHLDGSHVVMANLQVDDNQLLGFTGAGDGIYMKDGGNITFSRNTIASNTNVHIAAAGMHFNSDLPSPSPNLINNIHCENHTDCLLVDGTDSVFAATVDAEVTSNTTLHIASTATGSVVADTLHNSANATCVSATFLGCVVRNDVTTSYLSSQNPPSPFGIMPRYQWQNGGMEIYTGANGMTASAPIVAGGTPPTLSGTGACATITTQVGGNWAGSGTCTGTTGVATFVITLNHLAPHGYACIVNDITTVANIVSQNGTSTSACAFTAAAVTSGDVLVFKATAY